MKLEWIKKEAGVYQITDITQAISSITWGGSVSQAARTLQFSLLNGPYDPEINRLKLELALGDFIHFTDEVDDIFYGEIMMREKKNEAGTIVYECYDFLIYLLNSTGVYNFSNTTAESIVKKVCSDFQIKIGRLSETNVLIKKLICDNDSIYDLVIKAYTKASIQTNKKYICRMEGDKFFVKEKGIQVKTIVLTDKTNITGISYQESIHNMTNLVKIYDDKNNQIGEIKNDEWVDRYGIFQKVYKKETGVNENSGAEKLLNGVEMALNLTAIMGDISCIAGNSVEVFDSSTNLNGLFWIDEDTHLWENGNHTMNLTLNFHNLMDEREDED